MCGRFTQRAPKADVATLFDAIYIAPFIAPRYNVAPTQPALVARLDHRPVSKYVNNPRNEGP